MIGCVHVLSNIVGEIRPPRFVISRVYVIIIRICRLSAVTIYIPDLIPQDPVVVLISGPAVGGVNHVVFLAPALDGGVFVFVRPSIKEGSPFGQRVFHEVPVGLIVGLGLRRSPPYICGID